MPNSQQNNKKIAKNTLFLYFRMILIMGVTLYTSRVVLNALGVVDYGVYNVVGGMVAMFAFLNTALAQATERYIAYGLASSSVDEQRKTFSMLLNVHISIALILFVLCETVGLWLFYHKLVIPADRMDSAFWVMQCSIVTLIITVTQVPYNASIFGHEKMSIYAYISILEAVLKLLAVLSLKFFFADKLLAYGILIMIVSAIIAFCYRFYCVSSFSNCKYRLYWKTSLFKDVFGYTSWSLIGNLAWTLNNQGMNFLVNIFFGPVYNAARGVAVNVQSAVTSFATNFLGASVPQIIKSYASNDLEYMNKLCIRSGKFGFLLFMCLALPIISAMQPILDIWLVTPPQMTAAFCILSLVQVQITTLGGTLQNVVQATGDVKVFQLSNGVLQLSAVPIAYVCYLLGAPVLTYIYVLIAISVISIYVQIWAVRRLVKSFSMKRYFVEVVLRSCMAFALPLCLALYFFFTKSSFLIAIIHIAVTLFVTLLSSWYIGMVRDERQWVVRIITSKFNKNKE